MKIFLKEVQRERERTKERKKKRKWESVNEK